MTMGPPTARRRTGAAQRIELSSGMRKFDTEGPVVADRHYCIPPLERVELDEVLGLTGTNGTSCCMRRGRPGRPRPCWRCGTCSTAAPKATSVASRSTSRPPSPRARTWARRCRPFSPPSPARNASPCTHATCRPSGARRWRTPVRTSPHEGLHETLPSPTEGSSCVFQGG